MRGNAAKDDANGPSCGRLDLCGNRIGFGFREHGPWRIVVIERRGQQFDRVSARRVPATDHRGADIDQIARSDDAGACVRRRNDVCRVTRSAVDATRRSKRGGRYEMALISLTVTAAPNDTWLLPPSK